MRPINADALMKAMYHRAFETDDDTMWQSGCWVRYRAIEQVVNEQPTVDVQPVRHGKWMLYENQNQDDVNNGNYLYVCSNCNYSDIHAKTVEVPFCWHCGARMDGDGYDLC